MYSCASCLVKNLFHVMHFVRVLRMPNCPASVSCVTYNGMGRGLFNALSARRKVCFVMPAFLYCVFALQIQHYRLSGIGLSIPRKSGVHSGPSHSRNILTGLCIVYPFLNFPSSSIYE